MQLAAPRRSSEAIAVWAVRAAIGLAVAQAVAQFAAYKVDDVHSTFDSSTDGGVFGALGVMMFAAAVACAWLVATAVSSVRTEALWCAVVLSVVFALELSDVGRSAAIAAPFAAAALVLLWRLGRADEAAGRLLRAGCIVLGVAFLGHAVGAWLVNELGQGSDSWAYQVKVVVKHAGELAGWTLVAAGLIAVQAAES